MTETPAGYTECIARMMMAARIWLKLNPNACLHFSDVKTFYAQKAGFAEGVTLALCGALTEVAPEWAQNPLTLELLQAMDIASRREATFMMAEWVLEELDVLKNDKN